MAKRILIIEDERELVLMLKIRLKAAGFEVVEAFDGEEGLKQIAACSPDLVLLDLMLPKLSGAEVFARLRKDQALRHIPVVVLTGSMEDMEDKDGVEFSAASGVESPIGGAQARLLKPFEFKELQTVINRLLYTD